MYSNCEEFFYNRLKVGLGQSYLVLKKMRYSGPRFRHLQTNPQSLTGGYSRLWHMFVVLYRPAGLHWLAGRYDIHSFLKSNKIKMSTLRSSNPNITQSFIKGRHKQRIGQHTLARQRNVQKTLWAVRCYIECTWSQDTKTLICQYLGGY